MPAISVIICTHNPREDYLRRVLDALKAQTLPKEHWELLLMDNASTERLADVWDLSWHRHARHLREDELGLTPARVRGIQESLAELLVFVDDDNVLASDYLENIMRLNAARPWVGVWSAGEIEPNYENQPAVWLGPFLRFLALNSRPREVWSNDYNSGLLPIGAGMSLQKAVAAKYARQVQGSSLGRSLDRVGSSLFAAGDTNIGLCACEMGLACGHAPTLRVVHLIPRRRTQSHYLIRLARDVLRSSRVLYLGHGLLKLSRVRVNGEIALGLFRLPWSLVRHGPGLALLGMVSLWADWLALGDYNRLCKSAGRDSAKQKRFRPE